MITQWLGNGNILNIQCISRCILMNKSIITNVGCLLFFDGGMGGTWHYAYAA